MNDGREVILGSDDTVDHWTLISKNEPPPNGPVKTHPGLDVKDHKS
jgi:hypothetical protein